MEPKTQLEKLDILLSLFKNEEVAIGPFFIREMMEGQGATVSDSEIQRFINQLAADKYIMQDHDYNWMIRIEGLLFEGYAQKITNTAAENTRLENIEQAQKTNRNWMTFLTILIAVGTLVAAIYYGIEIWKFYCQTN